MKKLKYFDLFSGCGGMSWGFHEAQIENTGAVDFWEPAEIVYKKNYPKSEFRKLDLFDNKNIKEVILWQKKLKPDIIIGGPPCQGFSTLGKRSSTDRRNNLVKTFLDIAKSIGPKFFILENVKAIVNTKYDEKITYAEFIKKHSLKSTKSLPFKYNVHCFVLNSIHFGTAQTRQRAFFIGVRNDLSLSSEQIKSMIDKYYEPALNLEDVIFDLPRLAAGEGEEKLIFNNRAIFNHKAMGHGVELVNRLKCVPPGGGLLDVKDHLLTPHLQKMKSGAYGSGGHVKNIYGRLEWNKPSGTIIAGMDKITCGRYVHPEDDRLLTVRECARIQSFPDNFIFTGGLVTQYYLVGNSVPPKMSHVLARTILDMEKMVSKNKNTIFKDNQI